MAPGAHAVDKVPVLVIVSIVAVKGRTAGQLEAIQLEDTLLLRRTESLWIPFFNMLALFGVFLTVVLTLSALRKAFVAQQRLIGQLKEALSRVHTLTGLLPMCSWCKKVRDDHGYWKAVEAYIQEHSDAEVTHGICPDCMEKHHTEQPRALAGKGTLPETPPPDAEKDV